MRCKLVTIIKNCEASGQGDGGMDREEEGDHEQLEIDAENAEANADEINNESSSIAPAFGSLRQRPARALDSRAAILRGMPSYILYYWEVAESQQLLSLCLQRLSDNANASDASSAALVSRRGGGSTSTTINIASSGGSSRSSGRGSHRSNTDDETDDNSEWLSNGRINLETIMTTSKQLTLICDFGHSSSSNLDIRKNMMRPSSMVVECTCNNKETIMLTMSKQVTIICDFGHSSSNSNLDVEK
ncbi:hypothetical protein MHU86_23465 [Fragilaria crotonensis]|nr:hypothetical protein MHU86_23465 [Fragilaria crotonensis]